MLEELKKLLEKYNASIIIESEGEGYSQINRIAIEINVKNHAWKTKTLAVFNDEITKYNL